ncbi:hypothetical protein [Brevundimonas sp.]|uniref:hypothetical protein n=1 Tax=Brevundimonas sp. TaxID=1871086 RepID=UPI002D494F55|nr:hypothetical protein [Brevundimonas sp.]HYC68885.1 hypothetical protein [Brevundimonas sp.]
MVQAESDLGVALLSDAARSNLEWARGSEFAEIANDSPLAAFRTRTGGRDICFALDCSSVDELPALVFSCQRNYCVSKTAAYIDRDGELTAIGIFDLNQYSSQSRGEPQRMIIFTESDNAQRETVTRLFAAWNVLLNDFSVLNSTAFIPNMAKLEEIDDSYSRDVFIRGCEI